MDNPCFTRALDWPSVFLPRWNIFLLKTNIIVENKSYTTLQDFFIHNTLLIIIKYYYIIQLYSLLLLSFCFL